MYRPQNSFRRKVQYLSGQINTGHYDLVLGISNLIQTSDKINSPRYESRTLSNIPTTRRRKDNDKHQKISLTGKYQSEEYYYDGNIEI